jgi:hypothetical protein
MIDSLTDSVVDCDDVELMASQQGQASAGVAGAVHCQPEAALSVIQLQHA